MACVALDKSRRIKDDAALARSGSHTLVVCEQAFSGSFTVFNWQIPSGVTPPSGENKPNKSWEICARQTCCEQGACGGVGLLLTCLLSFRRGDVAVRQTCCSVLVGPHGIPEWGRGRAQKENFSSSPSLTTSPCTTLHKSILLLCLRIHSSPHRNLFFLKHLFPGCAPQNFLACGH